MQMNIVAACGTNACIAGDSVYEENVALSYTIEDIDPGTPFDSALSDNGLSPVEIGFGNNGKPVYLQFPNLSGLVPNDHYTLRLRISSVDPYYVSDVNYDYRFNIRVEDTNSPNCDATRLLVNPSIVSTTTICNHACNSDLNLKADGTTLSYTGRDLHHVKV